MPATYLAQIAQPRGLHGVYKRQQVRFGYPTGFFSVGTEAVLLAVAIPLYFQSPPVSMRCSTSTPCTHWSYNPYMPQGQARAPSRLMRSACFQAHQRQPGADTTTSWWLKGLNIPSFSARSWSAWATQSSQCVIALPRSWPRCARAAPKLTLMHVVFTHSMALPGKLVRAAGAPWRRQAGSARARRGGPGGAAGRAPHGAGTGARRARLRAPQLARAPGAGQGRRCRGGGRLRAPPERAPARRAAGGAGRAAAGRPAQAHPPPPPPSQTNEVTRPRVFW